MTSVTASSTPDAVRRRRARAALGAVALVVALALLAWLLLRDGDPDPEAGPVAADERVSVGWPQPAGKAFGFGLPVVFNRGEGVAVLERISVVNPPPGLEVLDTRIGGPERRITQSTSGEWPSRRFRDLHPVSGYRLARDAPGGAQLVFVLRAREPGRYVFNEIEVQYRVGDSRHRSIVHNGLRVCAFPQGESRPGRCPPPRNL